MVLSLKGTLLYFLSKILPDGCEADAFSFTNFSHIDRSKSKSFSQVNSTGFIDQQCDWQQIPLHKQQHITAALYTSAIPQMLAKTPQFAALSSLSAVSKQIADQLNQLQLKTSNSELDHQSRMLSPLSQLWSEFEIETQRPGWVSFRLSEIGISLWLQQFQQPEYSAWYSNSVLSKPAQPVPKSSNDVDLDHMPANGKPLNISLEKTITKNSLRNSSIPIRSLDKFWADDLAAIASGAESAGADLYGDNATWPVQYTHARCCTLLRLWQAAQPALDLVSSAASQPSDPASLFWLTADQRLRVYTLQAQQLIQSLIATTDDLFWIPYRWPDRSYLLLLKRAGRLCQSFDQFYSACMGGFSQVAIAPASPEVRLFQARLGLVSVTQNVLEVLLRGHLAVAAPKSL